MGRLILITGGARSGKSAVAEEVIGRNGRGRGAAAELPPVTYLATAEAGDAEMAERIRRHRARRPPHWKTIEAPRDADRRLAECADIPGWVLLDCLTIFLANLLDEADDEAILKRVEALAASARAGRADVVIVTNEVGSGVVPEYPVGRRFRDLAGLANQAVARAATEVYLTVAGLMQRLK
jgi:adenosylcobinamide kinase/adenosylcobinamide-phosphate guanylyltransferase